MYKTCWTNHTVLVCLVKGFLYASGLFKPTNPGAPSDI